MPNVKFQHSNKATEAEDGEWMYDVVERCDGGIPFACKAGACGTCATPVVEGIDHVEALSAREKRTLSEHDLDLETHRLPCLKSVLGDLVWGKPVNARDASENLGVLDLEVESYRPLNLTVAEVRFFVREADFDFAPGQYMIFHIPDPAKKIRRSYSISTPPSERRHIEVCVRAVSGGAGSNYMHRLRPGARLQVQGPHGKFVLDEGSDQDILMVATGTGIAPIKSMLMHLLAKGSRRRVRLFFGVRHESDLFYSDLLRGLSAHYPDFEYRIILSQPDPDHWAGPKGRVTDLVDRYVTEQDAKQTEAYLCGGRAMVNAVRDQLSGLGFAKDAIRHERFY